MKTRRVTRADQATSIAICGGEAPAIREAGSRLATAGAAQSGTATRYTGTTMTAMLAHRT
jgi:hypothetical protein